MLSENLKNYREKNNLTKIQLGKKAKVHSNTIKNIEHGRNKFPTIVTVEKLSRALNVTVDELVK